MVDSYKLRLHTIITGAITNKKQKLSPKANCGNKIAYWNILELIWCKDSKEFSTAINRTEKRKQMEQWGNKTMIDIKQIY